ncbi:MAG: hypothetical protein HKO66_12935 [Saprospiraceae bacterium]|nr:Rho-binding antiterminator [Bacteroidia bacterium]NNE14625.1 hypothetical protein [Saprospiraceae bacterium]NNL93137.1 hypothetical protein [Saprospiraceae bacterium]
MEKYKPIACHLHDHIEHFATLRKPVSLSFLNKDGRPQTTITVIKDWVNEDGEEFLLTKEYKIRFDHILSIDNVCFKDSETCKIEV